MTKKRYIVQVDYEPAPRSFSRVRDAFAESEDDAKEQVRREFIENNPGVKVTALTVTRTDAEVYLPRGVARG